MSQLKVNSIIPVAGVPTGGGGGIIQVKSVVKTDTFSSNSTSFVDITGMSVSITPTSNTSKILVLVQCSVVGADAGTGIMLDRDGTEPLKATANGSRQRFTLIGALATTSYEFQYSQPANHISFLDSPATTNQVTYKLKAKCRTSSNFYVNTTFYQENNTNTSLGTSTITVMEVSA